MKVNPKTSNAKTPCFFIENPLRFLPHHWRQALLFATDALAFS